MPEGDGRPGGPLRFEPDPTHHVLAQVRDGIAGRSLENPRRLELLDPAHRRTGGSDQAVLTVIGALDAFPVVVVEARRRPAILLEASVVGLAVVDLRHEDRSRRGLPAAVGEEHLLAPILVAHVDLQQQGGVVTVDVAASDPPCEIAPVPAAPEQDAYRVGAGLEQWRDVVGLILEALVVAGPAGGEKLVANALAVEPHLVQAVAGHVGARSDHRAAQREVAPQHRHRSRLGDVLRDVRLDPAGLPVRRLQETHLPPRGLAPGRSLASVVPGANLPVVAAPRLQRRPRVSALGGLIRSPASLSETRTS